GRFDPAYQGVDQFTCAQVRMLEQLREVDAGRDPRVAKRAAKEKAEAELNDTVETVFEAEFEHRKALGTMRSLGQWEAKARKYILKATIARGKQRIAFAKLPMSEVGRADLRALLRKIERNSGRRTSELVFSILNTLFTEHTKAHDGFINPLVRGFWVQPRRQRQPHPS